jgi:hypothetical protein
LQCGRFINDFTGFIVNHLHNGIASFSSHTL